MLKTSVKSHDKKILETIPVFLVFLFFNFVISTKVNSIVTNPLQMAGFLSRLRRLEIQFLSSQCTQYTCRLIPRKKTYMPPSKEAKFTFFKHQYHDKVSDAFEWVTFQQL